MMETLEQIKADAVEVFHFDRECRPQDRAHAYLGKYRVRRGYNDTAMQVDGSRYTYGVNSKSCQFLRSCKRSVSADNYQSVDAVFSADICSTFLAFQCTHLCAAGGIKDGTSALDGVGYIAGCHVDDFFVHQSVVAFQDTFHLNALLQTSSYGCTDRCVHTWCITTAGKHSDCLYLVSRCHMNSSISSHTLINE